MSAAKKLEELDALSDDPFDNPPEKRTPLNFRVAATTKAHMDALLEIYRLEAGAVGRNPKDIDMTWLAELCLRSGIDIAWAKLAKRVGVDFQGAPSNPLEIAQMKKSILDKAKLTAELLQAPTKPHSKK